MTECQNYRQLQMTEILFYITMEGQKFIRCIKNNEKKYKKPTMIGFSFVPAVDGGTIGSLLKPTSPAASASISSLRLPACCSLSVGMVNFSQKDRTPVPRTIGVAFTVLIMVVENTLNIFILSLINTLRFD